MENNKVILIGLIGIIAIGILFANYSVLEKREYVVKFEIGGRAGFDLNSSALTFGRVPVGSSATRSIFIENGFNREVFVSLSSSREISDVFSISENDFWLEPGENKTLSFFVHAYPEASTGAYNGKVSLVVSRFGGLFDGK